MISHVAMKDVPDLLTTEKIEASIGLTDRALKMAGYDRPRIVVEAARLKQINCIGPLPADTLWLKVRDGEYDAVVTMYHDQGQIAIKLLGFDRGVSVLAGLPIPMTTPAHGSAFDIAGQGKSNRVPTKNAFTMCLNMASRRDAVEAGDASIGR